MRVLFRRVSKPRLRVEASKGTRNQRQKGDGEEDGEKPVFPPSPEKGNSAGVY